MNENVYFKQKINYTYFSKARKDWWNHERYSSHVFYYHD